jgi:hypothetical protein
LNRQTYVYLALLILRSRGINNFYRQRVVINAIKLHSYINIMFFLFVYFVYFIGFQFLQKLVIKSGTS